VEIGVLQAWWMSILLCTVVKRVEEWMVVGVGSRSLTAGWSCGGCIVPNCLPCNRNGGSIR